MRVVGIDASLTRTGVAIIDTDTGAREVHSIPGGHDDGTVAGRWGRLDDLAYGVSYRAGEFSADMILIEAPAHSRVTGKHHDRSGLWWLIIDRLSEFSVVEVAPTGLKKFATGKGNAGKDEVLLAVSKRWPDAPVTNNDEADAWVLACMGVHHLGGNTADLPKTHLDALNGVAWPKENR